MYKFCAPPSRKGCFSRCNSISHGYFYRHINKLYIRWYIQLWDVHNSSIIKSTLDHHCCLNYVYDTKMHTMTVDIARCPLLVAMIACLICPQIDLPPAIGLSTPTLVPPFLNILNFHFAITFCKANISCCLKSQCGISNLLHVVVLIKTGLTSVIQCL